MTDTQRVLLATAMLLADVLLFALPLTGIAAAWILIARPPWFRQWIEALYEHGNDPNSGA